MGDAYICDRCGELSEGEPHSKMDVEERGLHEKGLRYQVGDGSTQELCRNCARGLKEWFNSG